MKRIVGTGLSILVLSAFTVPSVKAETKIERQLQLTHPAQITTKAAAQNPVNAPDQTKAIALEAEIDASNTVAQEQRAKLSGRDRIIREYQTQMVIPEH